MSIVIVVSKLSWQQAISDFFQGVQFLCKQSVERTIVALEYFQNTDVHERLENTEAAL